jgi:hypothetical protein
MPLIKLTDEDIRKPQDSKVQVLRCEDAADCFGEVCGLYHEEDGEAVKPGAHSHLVITGHDPRTAPRVFPIPKGALDEREHFYR